MSNVARLLEDGVLFRGTHGKPEPRHDYRERGFFRVRVTERNGETYLQTLVSPLGLQWLSGRYPPTDGQLSAHLIAGPSHSLEN